MSLTQKQQKTLNNLPQSKRQAAARNFLHQNGKLTKVENSVTEQASKAIEKYFQTLDTDLNLDWITRINSLERTLNHFRIPLPSAHLNLNTLNLLNLKQLYTKLKRTIKEKRLLVTILEDSKSVVQPTSQSESIDMHYDTEDCGSLKKVLFFLISKNVKLGGPVDHRVKANLVLGQKQALRSALKESISFLSIQNSILTKKRTVFNAFKSVHANKTEEEDCTISMEKAQQIATRLNERGGLTHIQQRLLLTAATPNFKAMRALHLWKHLKSESTPGPSNSEPRVAEGNQQFSMFGIGEEDDPEDIVFSESGEEEFVLKSKDEFLQNHLNATDSDYEQYVIDNS